MSLNQASPAQRRTFPRHHATMQRHRRGDAPRSGRRGTAKCNLTCLGKSKSGVPRFPIGKLERLADNV
jgi:hypothetical protein